ncbi:MAG: phosphatidylglycerophosphatase A [Bacilli bacterium]|nr:phosphatidylglycerophosphatase A [Bacilli bacterium]MDD3305084.1 phosphatidylglycerophosphatase A [Bacilli bacterium]MDD4053448.1 phosphatidylglycerophosphatase A [Bacilli bacterium]MDD4410905.1 phosphatidylglycerophosphatase A [Bacilli bacterium]
MKELALKKLQARGVEIDDIAILVFELQRDYQDITLDDCRATVQSILSKSETICTILTGIAIDVAAENDLLDPEINDLIKNDYGLYGLDEILALSIVNMNGSIALTNFGYLDKTKPRIIGIIDKEGKKGKKCHTFLDDIICAIASSAASRIAHKTEKNKK